MEVNYNNLRGARGAVTLEKPVACQCSSRVLFTSAGRIESGRSSAAAPGGVEPRAPLSGLGCPLRCLCSLRQSGGGEMDLREYVVALSVVCRPSQTLDTMQLAFKASVERA